MSFVFIELGDILNCLLKSERDSEIYEFILKEYYAKDKVRLSVKEYNSSRKSDRLELLEKAARDLEKHNLPKYKDYKWHEIIGEKIAEVVTIKKWFNYIFGHTPSEEDTYRIVKRYLNKNYDRMFETYNIKKEKWPDFFALKARRLRKPLLIAVDAKVNYSELIRFLDQATRFFRYCNYVYLAATPGLAVEVGNREKQRAAYGEEILLDKLKKMGIGLLIVNMTNKKVSEVLEPKKSDLLSDEDKETCLRKLGVT